ncbi:MAG: PD-(D/E)XK motif protein [Bacteroidia bacterium]|nr:PD-(D/E)XK motif protein [Bacteroidia bacterium]
MIDYLSIWNSINDESKNSTQKTQIARKIPSSGVFPVFLATDFGKGTRLFYIKITDDHKILTENLPKFRGLEISIIATTLGEYVNKEFIKFTQSIPNTNNIFELVISDICDKIIKINDRNNLNSTLINVLNEWKIFFEKQENEILSIERQKGLIGELHFLKDYLFKKYSFTNSLLYWTGSDRTNHDFQILSNAIEVKATSSKQHKKFNISSEKQLDNTGLDHLFISLFSFNVHNNMPDKTLPAFVKEINFQIQDDPIASYLFQIKLAKYGYNELHNDKYLNSFSLFDVKFFEVVDGFPRLLQCDLPEGVGDLKYSVVVSACSPFEIKTDIINHI